jgi:hypothetical protein
MKSCRAFIAEENEIQSCNTSNLEKYQNSKSIRKKSRDSNVFSCPFGTGNKPVLFPYDEKKDSHSF